jgi:uncharacterized membrane protein
VAKSQHTIQKGKKLGVFTKSFGNFSRLKTVLPVIIMCSVSIMAFLPTSPLAYGETETWYLHGYVVDENGAILSGVTVELVSGGAIQATSITDSTGHFVMEDVERGTYSLYFKKIGYAEVVKSVTLQTAETNIGTTVMSRVLRLSTSILSLVSYPGNQFTIPFTAQNSGEKAEVVEFSVSKPDEWSTRILEQGYEATKVSIPSGQSLALQLEITVPSTAPVDLDYNVSLTAIGTNNSSVTFTIRTRSQPTSPTATVSGRIVNEKDNGIQGVTVDSYSSESLIQSAETSSDGSFTLEQATGTTFSLHFSKDGYVEVTKTVSLESTSDKLELGKIALAKAVTLHSSILNTVANPGEKVLLPFSVSNIGEDQETVQLSASKPDGWTTRILDQSGREVKNAALSSSATLNLQLEVMIPLAATGDNNLTITAAGKTISTLNLLINVEPMNESIIFCQFPGKWALPGDTVVFHVELKNPFGFEMRYRISVDSELSNWTASIKTASGESVTEIFLGADESVDLVIELESPTSATAGENYELVVRAESTDQNVTSSLPLLIALNEPEVVEEIKITTKFPEVTVEAGEVIEYQITVANLGDTNKLLFLSIAPPTDWKAVFKSGATEITRLDIDAGSSEALTIEVTPPSTVSLDSYDIPVQIKSETGTVFAETDLKATIVGAYALDLELSTLLTSTNSGDSTSFTATVTNTGFSYVTAVGINFDVEDGWDVTISPAQVELLRPQESVTFNVLVDTPEGTVAGDYMVTLAAVSDQVSSSQTQVRTTVTTSTSWGLYGLGLAVVLIVALVLIFKKFKRR